jgi:hypothetical protein
VPGCARLAGGFGLVHGFGFAGALRDAGVPAEMHVYAQGSHGNSLDPQYGPTAFWPQRCEEWLRFNGWLKKVN